MSTIVAIQRELGAGGRSVGEALAAELSAALLDERAIIDLLSRRGGFSAEYLSKTVERPPTFAHSFVTDLARAGALVQAMEWRPSEESVIDEIRALVYEHAARGNVVVIGQGGPQLLAGAPNTVRVFSILLHASLEWRVRAVMHRFAIPHSEAADRVRRTDDLRKRYLQHFFSADMYDARRYDLVIDTERIGMEAAVETAKAALRGLTGADAASTDTA